MIKSHNNLYDKAHVHQSGWDGTGPPFATEKEPGEYGE